MTIRFRFVYGCGHTSLNVGRLRYICRPVKNNNDQPPDLPTIVTAIRGAVVAAMSTAHPEGHRVSVTDEPQIPDLRDEPMLGFDVWEIREPDGPPERLLARLVTEDQLVCVFGFDQHNVARNQTVYGNPASRADLITIALLTEIDEGLAE